jgi:hypothetical protein
VQAGGLPQMTRVTWGEWSGPSSGRAQPRGPSQSRIGSETEAQATPLAHTQPCPTIIAPHDYQHQQRSTVLTSRTDPDSHRRDHVMFGPATTTRTTHDHNIHNGPT